LKRLAIFAALLAAASSAASAQRPEVVAFVQRLDAAEPAPQPQEVSARALELLRARFKDGGGCVPGGIALDAPEPAVFDPSVTPRLVAGDVRNGWTVTGRPQGCKAMPVARFILLRMADGRLDLQLIAMGDGIASPDFRSIAATGSVALGLLGKGRQCGAESLRFESTRLVTKSPGLSANFHGTRLHGTWQEAWTFGGCGRRAQVRIDFTADDDGKGNFVVDPRQAKLVD
jgi:hypothetical protein